MNMTSIRLATRSDFDRFATSSTPGTSWDFMAALTNASNFKNISVYIEMDALFVVIPLLERRIFGVYPLALSLPFGLYGGVLCRENIDSSTYFQIMKATRKFLKTSIVLQNPFRESLISQSGIPKVKSEIAQIVEIGDRSYQEVFEQGFEHKMRKNIRRAKQSGVVISSGNSFALVSDFYNIYQIANRRWGQQSPRFQLDFFQKFVGLSNVEFRLAYLKNRPVAGLMLLRSEQCYFAWFGGMDQSFTKSRANDFLHADLVEHAIGAKFSAVSFGSSGRRPGVRRFKESLGAKDHPYGLYFLGNWLERLALRVIMSFIH